MASSLLGPATEGRAGPALSQDALLLLPQPSPSGASGHTAELPRPMAGVRDLGRLDDRLLGDGLANLRAGVGLEAAWSGSHVRVTGRARGPAPRPADRADGFVPGSRLEMVAERPSFPGGALGLSTAGQAPIGLLDAGGAARFGKLEHRDRLGGRRCCAGADLGNADGQGEPGLR